MQRYTTEYLTNFDSNYSSGSSEDEPNYEVESMFINLKYILASV